MLLTSAQIEGHSIRREQGAEKKAWDAEPAYGTDMRVIAMFSGLCAADALTSRGSVFSHDFMGLERLPKLATSYMPHALLDCPGCGQRLGASSLRPPRYGPPVDNDQNVTYISYITT